MEDLVRMQGDEIKWLQTEMSKQADVIKRLLPLEAEVTNLKGHSQRVDKRLVLGIQIFAIIVIVRISHGIHCKIFYVESRHSK